MRSVDDLMKRATRMALREYIRRMRCDMDLERAEGVSKESIDAFWGEHIEPAERALNYMLEV